MNDDENDIDPRSGSRFADCCTSVWIRQDRCRLCVAQSAHAVGARLRATTVRSRPQRSPASGLLPSKDCSRSRKVGTSFVPGWRFRVGSRTSPVGSDSGAMRSHVELADAHWVVGRSLRVGTKNVPTLQPRRSGWTVVGERPACSVGSSCPARHKEAEQSHDATRCNAAGRQAGRAMAFVATPTQGVTITGRLHLNRHRRLVTRRVTAQKAGAGVGCARAASAPQATRVPAGTVRNLALAQPTPARSARS